MMNNKTDISDFTKIRESKIIVRDLNNAIKEIQNSINSLQPYKNYGTIRDVIVSMNDTIVFLEIHLSKHKLILKKLGHGVKDEN